MAEPQLTYMVVLTTDIIGWIVLAGPANLARTRSACAAGTGLDEVTVDKETLVYVTSSGDVLEVDLWFDDEFLLRGSKFNAMASTLQYEDRGRRNIRGTCMLTVHDGAGGTRGFTTIELVEYTKELVLTSGLNQAVLRELPVSEMGR